MRNSNDIHDTDSADPPSGERESNLQRVERLAGLAALVLLFIGCFLVLKPFITALLWAGVLSFSTWPAYEWVLRKVQQRKILAASIMTLLITVILVVPFVLVGFTLAENVRTLAATTREWFRDGPLLPPDWILRIPGVGAQLYGYLAELVGDSARLLKYAEQMIEPVTAWGLANGLRLSRGVAELALSVLIVFFFYRDGMHVATHLRDGLHRIAGERGQRLMAVAGKTVQGVVYGVLGTALLQATLLGVGLVIAGVPGAPALALVGFLFAVLPLGTPLVWVPACIWLFTQGATGSGLFLVIWGIGVSSIDNFVRPWLISQGNRMPYLLILFGVLGGALAFGFIGVFLGPTLVAILFRLIEDWLDISPT